MTLRSAVAALAAVDPVDLALRLTLLDLLLRPVGGATSRPIALVVAVAGLLVPGALRRAPLWLALAALAAARVVVDWPFGDNHAYLLAYWCLAAALAVRSASPAAFLAQNARLLVGLAFAFALLWKVALSGDFIDGTFFRVTLVIDPRFEWIATGVGGISREQLEVWRAELLRHADVSPAGAGVALPARLEALALVATAATVAIEGAIAVAFLGPGRWLAALRDPLLLVFCAGTYAFVPVPGFGWLLVALGVAQCPPERRTLRLLYLAAFALLILYGALPGRRA